MFHRFVDEESFFVSTLNTRASGPRDFVLGSARRRYAGTARAVHVMQAWTDGNNPFKTPGVRLGIKRLTANSMVVFEQLLITRSAAKPPPAPVPRSDHADQAASPQRHSRHADDDEADARRQAQTTRATPSAVSIAIGVPKAIPKSPSPKPHRRSHAASRVELSQPARASSEPIPEPIVPSPTDVIEEKTDVREPKLPVAELEPSRYQANRSEAERHCVQARREPAPEAERHRGNRQNGQSAPAEAKVDPHVQETKVDPLRATHARLGLVLPANPLMNLSDESLEGYVDCTLYEETGNFFPVDPDEGEFVDEVVPPPVLAPKPAVSRTLTPIPYALHEPRQPTITPLPPTPYGDGRCRVRWKPETPTARRRPPKRGSDAPEARRRWSCRRRCHRRRCRATA